MLLSVSSLLGLYNAILYLGFFSIYFVGGNHRTDHKHGPEVNPYINVGFAISSAVQHNTGQINVIYFGKSEQVKKRKLSTFITYQA